MFDNPYMKPIDAFEQSVEAIVDKLWGQGENRDFYIDEEPELKQYLKDLPLQAWNYFPDEMLDDWNEHCQCHLQQIYTGDAAAGERAVEAYKRFMQGLKAWKEKVEGGQPADIGGHDRDLDLPEAEEV